MDTPINVLITGCSSGIGYELLKRFDQPPYRVTATALPESVDKLADDPAARSGRIRVRPLDVTDYQAAAALVAEHERDFGPVRILINNAGISYRSAAEDMTPSDEQLQMQVNYLGPIHLVRLCLPGMRRQRAGHVINVSSVGGMMAMPTMSSYSASKFALEGASEALWYEMRPWNIKVTLVRPGFINSLAFTKVKYSETRRNAGTGSPYDAHYANMTRFVERLMRRSASTSASVADAIFKVANQRRPPLRIPGTFDAFVFHYVRRLLPRALYHRLLFACLPNVKDWGDGKPPTA